MYAWGPYYSGYPYKHAVPLVHPYLPTETGFAKIYVDDNSTKIMVDVVNFSVDEIFVTTENEEVVISGQHEDKEDDHGFISRSFTRRFPLQENSIVDKLRCDVDMDGILTVTVPRKQQSNGKTHVINTPIPARHPSYAGGFLGKMASAFFTSHADLPSLRGVEKTKDNFRIKLELPHFKPEEITVKTIDDFLVVQGQHEEKKDGSGNGFISRSFKRRYHLPLNADKDEVKCGINKSGILTVTVPRINTERVDHEKVYKVVTIP